MNKLLKFDFLLSRREKFDRFEREHEHKRAPKKNNNKINCFNYFKMHEKRSL